MIKYIAIALAIFFMAIPASAYDQTYTLTQDDFTCTSGSPLPISFNVTFSTTPSGDALLHTFYSPNISLEGYYIISTSPDSQIYYTLHDIEYMHSLNETQFTGGNSLLYYSPYFVNNKTIYTKIYISMHYTDENSGTGGSATYTLTHSCPLGPNVISKTNPQEPPISIDGTIKPTAPVIDSFSLEQYFVNNHYNERHVLHFAFSDMNGYDNISSIQLSITDINNSVEIINRIITPNIIPINDTHAQTSYGVLELYPGSTYSVTLIITDSTALPASVTVNYTSKSLSEPVSEILFSVDPISFCDTQAGFNAEGNLTLHNHAGPTVKITSLSFSDFTIVSRAGYPVGEIAALNLKYSIPTTTLSSGESVTFPLKLYIPPGTKAGTIYSAGRIELTTV